MNYERRLEKLEAHQFLESNPPTFRIVFVAPGRGVVSALWTSDDSRLERRDDESEDAFKARLDAHSAIVSADAKRGGDGE